MKSHDFKIIQNRNCMGSVFMDGVELCGVQPVAYSYNADCVPTITLRIVAGNLNVEAEEK